MRVGDVVMVIGVGDETLPIGAVGVISTPWDGQHYGVMFPGRRLPWGQRQWYLAENRLMLIPARPILDFIPSNAMRCKVNHAC